MQWNHLQFEISENDMHYCINWLLHRIMCKACRCWTKASQSSKSFVYEHLQSQLWEKKLNRFSSVYIIIHVFKVEYHADAEYENP